MNIVLYGASGMMGSRIRDEALARGHQVRAVVRNPNAIPTLPNLSAVRGDVTDAQSIAETARGSDIAISAFQAAPPYTDFSKVAHALLTGLVEAGVPRVIVVGGAASLEVAPGIRLIDSPEFPEAYRAISLEHMKDLEIWQRSNEPRLTWTFFSPAYETAPGERTGSFRLGTDQLMTDATGTSRISAEDYAVALLDEVEKPNHPNRRFTIGY
ncbi:MAG: NAD(P)-dependent oxidoreductase [Candidatus Cybelea sp.]|jgi:putative NADH-flavin reductase